jgi:hypothetical protein
MVARTPLTSIHIDLSVAEPVKNREMSELDESYAMTPKIRRIMPPARTASETALFIDKSSFQFSAPGYTKLSRAPSSVNNVDQDDDNGDNQKNVNKTAHGIGSDQPQEPQYN